MIFVIDLALHSVSFVDVPTAANILSYNLERYPSGLVILSTRRTVTDSRRSQSLLLVF